MSVDDNKGSIRYLFVFYSIPIRPNVKIYRHKGTKRCVKHRTCSETNMYFHIGLNGLNGCRIRQEARVIKIREIRVIRC